MIKVSVYCLVYNHAQYLRSALDGFVKQKTNFAFEVFVHDDASTDDSADIIREYEIKYPDIIKGIYQTENQYSQGIQIFSNYIFPKMNGEYIAVCEGDDFWIDEQKLQLQVDFLDSHPGYVACVHNTLEKDYWHNKEFLMYSNEKEYDIELKDVVQGGSVCYQTSSLMYRRKLYNNLPEFMKAKWGFGDYPLSIYLSLMGKIFFMNRIMSVYRYGTQNSFTMRNGQSIEKMIKVYSNIVGMLVAIDEETEHKYSLIIEPVIIAKKYALEEVKGNYAVLKQPPFDLIYKSKGLIYRFKIFIKQHGGGITGLYLKVKRKIVYRQNKKDLEKNRQ